MVFPGYQAVGTLGRQLVDGEKFVKIFGSEFVVKAKIHTLGGFSAHAGQSQLLDWASGFKQKSRFYLVHGETDALQALQKVMLEKLNIAAEVPAEGTYIAF